MKLLKLALICTVMGACQTSKTQKIPDRSLLDRANQYAKDGLLSEASQIYSKVLEKQPKLPLAHRNLGLVQVKLGNYRKAIVHLERAITKFESNFDTNFFLAEAYRGKEDFAKAIFRYQKALQIKPDHPKALKALSWSYFKIRFYSEALQASKKLQKINPKDMQAPLIVARTLLKLKRIREASQVIKDAKTKVNSQALPYYLSVEGEIYRMQGEDEKAEAVWRTAIRKNPMLPSALLGMGRLFVERGKPAQGSKFLKSALRLKPNLPEAWFLLGLASEKSDRRKAVRYYRQFRKLAATDPDYLARLPEVKMRITKLLESKNQHAQSKKPPKKLAQ